MEEGADCVVVELVQDVDISIHEGYDLEHEKRIGRELDIHERHEGDELIDTHHGPECFHG